MRRWLSTSRTSQSGKRDREREAGKARARAEVRDGARLAHDAELEARQRVGEVGVERLAEARDARRRALVGCQAPEERAKTPCRCGGQPVARQNRRESRFEVRIRRIHTLK